MRLNEPGILWYCFIALTDGLTLVVLTIVSIINHNDGTIQENRPTVTIQKFCSC